MSGAAEPDAAMQQHAAAAAAGAAAPPAAGEAGEAEAAPAAVPLKVTAEQLGIVPGAESHTQQLELDVGNLCVFDPSPLAPADLTPLTRDATCLQLATSMTQALVGQLFSLPSEAVQGGRLAHLPAPTTALPREKPIPKAKPLTKWQKFAQDKGIIKRKRSKLAFDEEAGEWRRRHGYKRANDEADIPVIEARDTDVPGEDPFTQMRAEKRERVKAQRQQQAANVKQALKVGGAAAVPATLRLAASLPDKGRGKPAKRKELRDELKTASWLSGVSTASMGKFDRRLPGEKEGGRKLPGKRRKFIGVTDAASERALMSKTADRLLRERADDVLDIHKAIGKLEAAARGERHAAKAAGGGGGGGGGGGSGGGGGKKKGGSSKGGSSKGGSSKGGRDGRRAAGAGGRSGGKQLGGGVSKKGGKRGGK